MNTFKAGYRAGGTEFTVFFADGFQIGTAINEIWAKKIVDALCAINAHEALLEAANVGLRIAEAFEEQGGKMTQAYWDDKDQIVKAIAQAQGGKS